MPRRAGPDARIRLSADVPAPARTRSVEVDRRAFVEPAGGHATVSALLAVAALTAEPGGGLVAAVSRDGHVAAVLLR
ncbi:MAG TPA: hypothetical protein VFM54_16175 [Micromonosporaceae bacterium]|nr:hypothetical protein [Micromonosporaceae bacterium]